MRIGRTSALIGLSLIIILCGAYWLSPVQLWILQKKWDHMLLPLVQSWGTIKPDDLIANCQPYWDRLLDRGYMISMEQEFLCPDRGGPQGMFADLDRNIHLPRPFHVFARIAMLSPEGVEVPFWEDEDPAPLRVQFRAYILASDLPAWQRLCAEWQANGIEAVPAVGE